MAFNRIYFDESFDLAGIVSEPAPMSSGLPLITWPPPLRRTPFTERLITFGWIRRSFNQEGHIAGRIRRPFADEVVFTATSVKHIEEELSVGGIIVTEDVSDRVWEAFAKEFEAEQEEERIE